MARSSILFAFCVTLSFSASYAADLEEHVELEGRQYNPNYNNMMHPMNNGYNNNNGYQQNNGYGNMNNNNRHNNNGYGNMNNGYNHRQQPQYHEKKPQYHEQPQQYHEQPQQYATQPPASAYGNVRVNVPGNYYKAPTSDYNTDSYNYMTDQPMTNYPTYTTSTTRTTTPTTVTTTGYPMMTPAYGYSK